MAGSRKFHVSPFKPVRVRPSGGGKLMSNVSSDSAGINNYTVKRDWRRVLDREVRAEGYEYFWPNATIPMGNQPFPNAPKTSEPITLIAEAIQPNGRRAVVCATPTTIYRYFALDNGAYYTGDGTPDAYYAESGPNTPYYDDNPGVWIVIGSGFSPEAQRWESLSINGYLVLNNGVDLPMTYRVEEFAVKPIYELRENGIASVGNIAAFDTLLLVADVSEIDAAKLVEIMTPIPSGTVLASQIGSIQPNNQRAAVAANVVTVTGGNPFNAGMVGYIIQFVNGQSRTITGYTSPSIVTVGGDGTSHGPAAFYIIAPGGLDYEVTATAPIFDSSMVGRVMIWPSGVVRTITQYLSPTTVLVDINSPIALSAFAFKNPAAYAPFTDQNFINRIQYRLANSAADEPRRWAAIAPASITAGSINLKFDYPVLSFASGQQLEILGAGVLGGNLTATILYMGPDGMSAVLDTQAVTTVTSAGVQQSDALGSLVGFIDIQDDGSGIIGMLALEGYLVVYKDTSVFMGQFTGVAGAALDFSQQPPYRGDKTLYYRYTLISVNSQGQQFHLYAGRNSFYKFDLVTRRPVEVDTGELCKNLFFDNVDLPGILGVELVGGGQTYLNEISIPVSPGGSYYYTKGPNDLFLQQGLQIFGTGQFIAKGTSVNLIGIPSFDVTASLRALNNINVFAADNPITKEVFFCFPTAPGVDKAMRYDYYTGQVSTTSAVYTAAAAVKRPVAGIQVGPSENWFVMGANDGTMLRYGLTNTRPFLNIGAASQSGNTVTSTGNPAPQLFTPELVIGRTIKFADGTFANVTGFLSPTQITVGGPAMTRAPGLISVISASWHRLGQPYDSVMQAGLECFGTTFGEKTLESWLIVLASPSPGSTVRFDLLGATNPSPNPAVLGSRSVLAPLTKNAIGMNFIQNYFADRITVSGVNNPEEMIERVFNIAGIDSKAFTQR